MISDAQDNEKGNEKEKAENVAFRQEMLQELRSQKNSLSQSVTRIEMSVADMLTLRTAWEKGLREQQKACFADFALEKQKFDDSAAQVLATLQAEGANL